MKTSKFILLSGNARGMVQGIQKVFLFAIRVLAVGSCDDPPKDDFIAAALIKINNIGQIFPLEIVFNDSKVSFTLSLEYI